LVVVDLGDPWSVVPQARKMLKGSGRFIAICPTMNQLENLVSELVRNEFSDIECTEHILRTIDAREGKTRHSFHGIGHTAYLAFARKVFFSKRKGKNKNVYSPKQVASSVGSTKSTG
ncbi:MAG: tRNA methyltransferase, partial [Nitrosopumilales archaeon]|nr:tRNA methyltransferase [Nitrosopumilales archaeon]